MIRYLLIFYLLIFYAPVYGTLAGGRPNSFSEGQNAFAGVVNPANAVWVKDRLDLGTFWVYQKSSLNNHDNNPNFIPGKMDLTYKSRNLFTADAAIHKQFKLKIGSRLFDSSCSLAAYTMPSIVKLRTKKPIPISGTTPVKNFNKTNVISLVFSAKINTSHSIGFTIDYLYFSHRRNGYQNSDNPQRSVSPGHVTNKGMDHSSGIGFGVGWRWNITKKLDFGAAWTKKSYCGQYRKYRGFEPHHAENYTPQTAGGGFSYRFSPRFAGRVEVLWMNLGNMPNANNNVLSNGKLNTNKRGSTKSPGPGLRDATFINIGMGYNFNSMLSVGAGFSHRLKFRKSSNFISHTYVIQTIYDALTLGANLRYLKHDLFLSLTYGFRNRVSGFMPMEVGGGRFTGEKQTTSLSISWGYKF
jgi:long-chain fatty acid transport protein